MPKGIYTRAVRGTAIFTPLAANDVKFNPKFYIDGGGREHSIKHMATDHLINSAAALIRDQVRKELRVDLKRYRYHPHDYTKGEATQVVANMQAELMKRKTR